MQTYFQARLHDMHILHVPAANRAVARADEIHIKVVVTIPRIEFGGADLLSHAYAPDRHYAVLEFLGGLVVEGQRQAFVALVFLSPALVILTI
jgi:hypothetical protein